MTPVLPEPVGAATTRLLSDWKAAGKASDCTGLKYLQAAAALLHANALVRGILHTCVFLHAPEHPCESRLERRWQLCDSVNAVPDSRVRWRRVAGRLPHGRALHGAAFHMLCDKMQASWK